MKRKWIRLAIVSAAAFVAFATYAFARRDEAVLWSIDPDPAMVRPRNYCVMNPFRDRGPERAAQVYLESLRRGDVQGVAELVSSENREHIAQREREYPVLSWRVARRDDDVRSVDLTYWVRRGNGYSGEEEVLFHLTRVGDLWKVEGFSAVY